MFNVISHSSIVHLDVRNIPLHIFKPTCNKNASRNASFYCFITHRTTFIFSNGNG